MAHNASLTTSTTIPKHSALIMFLITLAFFLPVAAFPVTDIAIRSIWTGRSAGTLSFPFPPVLLSFITGGASMLLNCGFIIVVHPGTTYLYYSCANISYIILFLCGNFERMVDAHYMTNVPPEAWKVNSFYFTILFVFLQLAFNSALRRSGITDEDLGAFGRITNFFCQWNYLLNGSGRLDRSLARNMANQRSAVRPPAYEEIRMH